MKWITPNPERVRMAFKAVRRAKTKKGKEVKRQELRAAVAYYLFCLNSKKK